VRGVNAAVVGLLLSVLYHPVRTSAIKGTPDCALGFGGLCPAAILEDAALVGGAVECRRCWGSEQFAP